MQNLAGNKDCDIYIREELRRARIPAVPALGSSHGEVPSALTGRLGTLTFKRAWTYWTVSGFVPLSVARWLYEDSVGSTDIRVAGHCRCPPPEAPWISSVDGVVGVLSYHIDSEVGLRVFVDAIRAAGLHQQ